MATVLNTIYPPQVETFMPSFLYNGSAKIWFNVSSYNEDLISQIQFIHVSMVDQRNNTNVFAGLNGSNTVYPQYYPIAFNGSKNNNNDPGNKMGYDPDKKMYWLVIPPQVLKTNPYYNVGQYYKVQLRFDLTTSSNHPPYSSAYSDPTSFFYWDNSSNKKADALKLASYSNYNEDNFSEWSTGTLLKPILIPELALQRFNALTVNKVNPSTDILIAGKINFHKVSGDTKSRPVTEQLSWYQIQVLGNFDSGKIYPNDNNQINTKIDLSMLSINSNYQMRIIYEVNNGYVGTVDYPIEVNDYTETTDVNCSKSLDEENGSITLNITGLTKYSEGYLIVRRASHRTNFKQWELLAAKKLEGNEDTMKIVDTTIESMTGYRYQLQYSTEIENYRPIYVDNGDILHCDFYGGLFSDRDKRLKISFDFQVSNRANAANRSKTDTLGGQYPVFTQNSKLKYHTYSISGRISSEDTGELFLPKDELFGAEYYNYRYNNNSAEITDTSIAGGPSGRNTLYNTKKIQPNNDWLYEREYRDAVEEWLNNGKPKLFRSMTEGNMIVMLDGITMMPDVVLGRRLYNFSATMYEIGDGKSLDSIVSFELFDIIDER